MQVLDTTLRDGSYAINFQFTAADTSIICSELEKAGLGLIEIGHGVGLGATRAGHEIAAESDEDYLRAAAGSLKSAKFGMFCIPGIASLDDIDMAHDHGMGFLRVGTNVEDAATAQEYIERGRKHEMYVSVNFMKSYASTPSEFAEKAKLAQSFGAESVYVVDSCGGMFPSDVDAYFGAVREVCDVPLAFHAHDNLGLAMANTLRAVELGAVLVDSSLQGLGRSAGNAVTEILLLVLKRKGVDLGIDSMKVLDIGERHIRPMIRRTGMNSIDIVAGYAQFHSSYMNVIRRFSTKFRVDPRLLIIELCKIDKVNAPPELVESIAQKLQTSEGVTTARYDFHQYFGHEQTN